MTSVRTWLGSGSVLAGVGAAMLCGAGLAAADTGGNAGSDRGSANVAAASASASAAASAPQRSAHQGSKATPRAAAAISAARTASPTSAPRTRAAQLRATTSDAAAAPTAAIVPATAKAASATAASTTVAPSTVPVDPAQFAGTYYEQGSVKQFFSIGLVNTKAVYTLKQDGTIRVQNSGNYFFNRGPKSSIVGSAVPVNDINTALNVSFLPFNSAKPPGNYTILANATDYSWVIVSDPSGRTGYILTRDKIIPAEEYQQLLSQARALGITGRITPTRQYPA